MNMNEILIALSIKNDFDHDKTFQDISNRVYLSEEEKDNLLKNVNVNDFITIIDDDYPTLLKKACKPPMVILKEDKDTLNRLCEICQEEGFTNIDECLEMLKIEVDTIQERIKEIEDLKAKLK